MTNCRFSNLLISSTLAMLSLIIIPFSIAQGPLPDAPTPSAEAASPLVVVQQPQPNIERRFWDKENIGLFAGVAASNAADFSVTYSNLQSGGRELNPIVRVFGRSIGGLAANFAGETAGTVSLSYFFHKTHHYRLERAVSMVNISTSVGAVTYGLKHR
jgi:hypothetical protein